MAMSFRGIFEKLEEASVKRAALVKEGKIDPPEVVRPRMEAQLARERITGLPTKKQLAAREFEHTGPYWVKEGGTYTQTHPGIMSPDEFFMWKRKQAGLETRVVAPGSRIRDRAIQLEHFGPGYIQPSATIEERQASGAESRALYVARNQSRSEVVDANEYIQHHATHFGTDESKSLAAGLHNLYSDEYTVIEPKEGINIVVDPKKDQVTVLSDTPLTQKEKQEYANSVDRSSDVPNRVIFQDRGIAPPKPTVIAGGESGGGGGVSTVSGGLLLLVAVAAFAFFMLSGRR